MVFNLRWETADFVDMRALLLLLVVLGLAVLGRTQERTAHVVLENGTELSGRVVGLDLKELQLVVEEEIVTIRAADIKTCRFEAAGHEPPAAPAGESGAAPVAVPAQSPAPESSPPASGTGDGSTMKTTASLPSPAARSHADCAERSECEPGSLLEARIEAFDRIYPWLRPNDPLQWASLGLLLLSGLSLIIHLSVVVAGAESAAFGRSVGLSVLYLAAAAAQVALVSTSDFAVFSMLIGNTAVVLFALRSCYAMVRSSAFVAFAVQVGFVALGFGVLTLIDALLGSVTPA